VREPPPHVSEDDVIEQVWAHWLPAVERLTHLPVGFGAWHWQAWAGGRPALFVTLDQLGTHHTARSLEDAYRAAAALAAADLEFVLANRPTLLGRCTVPLGEDLLSVTPWVDGESGDGPLPDEEAAKSTAEMLRRLHERPAPPTLPRWRPLVHASFATRLQERTSHPWASGPYADRARIALREHMHRIATWTTDYLELAAATDPTTWVPTHGEPHTRNQLWTAGGPRLVDWESCRLAPRERDLKYLVEQGWGHLCEADPQLVDLFDLEWRLDEISQYADRFEALHTGTESDQVAIEGLVHELTREPCHKAGDDRRD
jgi:spectinomycin phosphotransferase